MKRVVWKLGEDVVGDPLSVAPPMEELRAVDDDLLGNLQPTVAAEPVFSTPGTALRADNLAMAEELDQSAEDIADLAGYQHAFFEIEEEAQKAYERLRASPSVRHVEIQHPPTRPVWRQEAQGTNPPPRVEVDLELILPRDFSNQQGYLEASPRGVDARFAWTVAGGRGDGVSIVDFEVGWDLGHEDLARRLPGLLHGRNKSEDHGTAVLGILGADHNGFGVQGIAPESRCYVAGVEFVNGTWNLEDAFYQVARRLNPGNVLLIELQAGWPNDLDYVPVEIWQGCYDAIKRATQRGLVVVEASGNGGNDLDDPQYQGWFDRQQSDSGAMLVGSADPQNLGRMPHSNYGSRLDVQAWGTDVVTTGGNREVDYNDLYNHALTSRCYTKSFGGTSSASAIVAGVAAVVNGALETAGEQPLNSIQMRHLLARTGASQGPPADEVVGRRPDLRSALLELGLST